jgi:hypothetical protein
MPTGPLGHLSVGFTLAFVLRLNLAVTVAAAVLPDLVDKPLTAVLHISEGRFIGHTLLFVFVVSLVFYAWKRAYGLAAFLGGISHLLLDVGGPLPLFYPFASYEFTTGSVDLGGYFRTYLVSGGFVKELIFAALLGLCVLAGYLLLKRRRRTGEEGGISASLSRFVSELIAGRPWR